MPAYDYHTQLQDSVASFSRTLTDQISHLSLYAGAGGEKAAPSDQTPAEEGPKSLPNAIGRAALNGGEKVGAETPLGNIQQLPLDSIIHTLLGAALKKYGQLMENVGNSRQKMVFLVYSLNDKGILTSHRMPISEANFINLC
jgi:hypothetical protein